MPTRTLSERELNRALLGRQLLLERKRTSIPRAVEQLGGLQTQYAPSPYVGLWSRLEDLRREDLTRALERKQVVQGTLMRITIHMVSARDYWPIALALRDARRKAWLAQGRVKTDARKMQAIAKRVRAELAGQARRRAELGKKLSAQEWNGAGLWVDLLRLPPSGTWEQRRADLYGLAEDVLGSPGEATRKAGLELLVRRYLGGFGPAPASDIANWAGLPTATVARALEGMRLRRFQDEQERELLDLPRARLPDPDTPAPVRFLPWWDATTLAHARRTGILPERFRPLVFNTKTPHSTATFLVDGRVAGRWSYERGRVVTEPFVRLGRAVLKEVAEEAERLAAFHD
jgi:winged helix DNA-binding protein